MFYFILFEWFFTLCNFLIFVKNDQVLSIFHSLHFTAFSCWGRFLLLNVACWCQNLITDNIVLLNIVSSLLTYIGICTFIVNDHTGLFILIIFILSFVFIVIVCIPSLVLNSCTEHPGKKTKTKQIPPWGSMKYPDSDSDFSPNMCKCDVWLYSSILKLIFFQNKTVYLFSITIWSIVTLK